MFKLKQIVALLMAGCLVLASGCSRSGSVGGHAVDRSNFNELGTFPVVKEKETITVMTYDMFNDSFGDTNRLTRYYEEKTNVRVNWIMIPLSQFKERVNLALASGDQIDLIISGENSQANFTNNDIMKLAEQKLILPVQDFFEEDSIYFKRRIDEDEMWRDLITLPNGNIYVLPSLNGCFACQYYGRMFVNKEFLKNVNLPYPSTPEEFRDMLLAFKNRDANGNGNSGDEIPFMGATDNFGCKVDTFLISAFVYNDGDNRLFLEKGKVTAAFTMPEFQEGLKFLNGLYRDGLISKDSFTASRTVRAQLNSAKYESVIGAIPNMHNGNLGTRETGQPVRWIDYESIAPLQGPDGYRVARYDPYEPYTLGGVIPVTCKNPALVVRWLDWFMSEEGTVMLMYGQKGVGWTDPDPGATGADGSPAKIKPIPITPGSAEYGNVTWGPRFPNYRSFDIRNSVQVADDMFAPDGSGRDRYGDVNIRQMYVPYAQKKEDIIPPLYFLPEQSMDMAALRTNINIYVDESIAKFIVGDLDIDSGWTAFQNNLKNLGLARYLDIIQTTYDKSPIGARHRR